MSIIDIAITFFIYIEKNKFIDELDIIIMAPDVGLEPTTYRLTAECSTDWANQALISDC